MPAYSITWLARPISFAVFLDADTSQQPLLTTPQHA
jgi:hypothetical protein